MTQSEPREEAPPIACDPLALSSRQRALHMAASIELLVRERLSQHELADGFELHFAPLGGRLVELAQWVERESMCCPWIEFALARSADGVLRLKLTARADAPGAKDLLRAGLDAAHAIAQGAYSTRACLTLSIAPRRRLPADHSLQL
jgi:hypothetical protein